MKLQVPVKQGTRVHKHFSEFVGEQAAEARRLLDLGILADSLPRMIKRTIKDALRDVTLAAPAESSGVEDEDAQSANTILENMGGWFDED